MTNVDPSDLTLWPTIRHLFPLWRAQWRLVSVGLACALVFTLLSLTIPILVQRTIDDAIDGGDRSLLVPYLAAIVVVASLRFVVNFTRRYATARIGITVEARLRAMLYDAYLRYPRAFYDRHATGEVISRATNDIYPVRYFIGWGVVQAIQSVMMLIGAAIVLTVVNCAARADGGARDAADRRPHVLLRAPRVPDLARGAARRRATSPRPPTRPSSGSRWCRRSAARTTCATASRTGRRPCGTRRCARRRSRRASSPASLFLPTLGIAAVLLFGGREAIAGNLTIGQFTLFITLLLQLVWPLEALGWIINLGQRATAAASRSFAWLDGIESLPEPAQPASLPDGPLPVRFEDVHFAYGDGRRGALAGSTSTSAPGEIVAVCGADRRRQDVAPQPAAALLRPDRRAAS